MRDFLLVWLQTVSLSALLIGITIVHYYVSERHFLTVSILIFWAVMMLTFLALSLIPNSPSSTHTIDKRSKETVSIIFPNYKKPNIARRLIHRLRR